VQGGVPAKSTLPKKGDSTEPSGTNQKQSGKKQKCEFNQTSKKSPKTGQQDDKKKSPKY
jgi:hypothetical protein